MLKTSAGLLLFQRTPELKVLLVHPGGPFFVNKDLGIWSIPKGEIEEGEKSLDVAIREFEEETGSKPTSTDFTYLGEITQKNGKIVIAWAFEGEFDPNLFKCNTFKMEWPPKSGQFQDFPEADRAEMFDIETAKLKINPAQVEFLVKLLSLVNIN